MHISYHTSLLFSTDLFLQNEIPTHLFTDGLRGSFCIIRDPFQIMRKTCIYEGFFPLSTGPFTPLIPRFSCLSHRFADGYFPRYAHSPPGNILNAGAVSACFLCLPPYRNLLRIWKSGHVPDIAAAKVVRQENRRLFSLFLRPLRNLFEQFPYAGSLVLRQ